MLVPLTIETGAAAVVAVSTYGPFGEPERATGRWLPWLRLGTVLALTAAAFGALAAGATAGALPGGTLALLRNLAGTAGLGLLSAVALGGAFGWVGPMAYLLITEVALNGDPTTPWVWAARPPHDHGAALCAGVVFAAGTVAITVLGSRNAGGPRPPLGSDCPQPRTVASALERAGRRRRRMRITARRYLAERLGRLRLVCNNVPIVAGPPPVAGASR